MSKKKKQAKPKLEAVYMGDGKPLTLGWNGFSLHLIKQPKKKQGKSEK